MKKELSRKKSIALTSDSERIDALYKRVSSHIDRARYNVQNTINIEMIKAYWLIGQDIVEEEQQGQKRAEYGKAILKGLSVKLRKKYKRGFSVDSLEKARKFFLLYQKEDKAKKSATVSRKSVLPNLTPNLSWSHYIELMTVSRPEARKFYALEASKNS